MTSFQIKLIALITMAIDHIGLFFFPQILLFRIIGRVSFPLFAWLIANGARHTSNSKKYLFRLFLLAIISQIPFIAANRLINPSFYALSAVFTLFFGLLAIEMIKKTDNKFLWIIIAITSSGIADLLQTDYGAAGVLSIIAFYIFYENITNIALSQVFIFSVFFLIPAVINIYSLGIMKLSDFWKLIEMTGLASLIFIAIYNRKQGARAKYLFYIFYPLQYVIFYLLKL